MASALFSLWFYGLALLFSAVSIPALTLAVALARPFLGRDGAMRLFRRFIRWYGLVIVTVLPFPFLRVRFRDFNPRPAPGPVVYICNHRSASDPFLLSLLPGVGVQVVNIWPFRIPVLGRYARWAGYLSVRELPFGTFEELVGRRLAEGANIGAFPEGTRSASRRMGPFHGALFRACLRHGATVAPVCIMGSEDKPRKGSLRLAPGTIRVHRLPDLAAVETRGMSPFEFKNHVRDRIARHILEEEGADEPGPPDGHLVSAG